uniref:Uncharacterized protein n=1 Tax=Lepeophtheirus salmonis TaxID=72036 RepID=A0A0K2V5U9_LEPSM
MKHKQLLTYLKCQLIQVICAVVPSSSPNSNNRCCHNKITEQEIRNEISPENGPVR